jgi:hypothetical protein
VGLDVGQLAACRSGESGQRPDLVQHGVLDLPGRELHRAAAKAHQIGEAGVCADAHAVTSDQAHCAIHHQRVAGAGAASDVGGGDEGYQRLVVADAVRAEAFPHVTVEVDFHTPTPLPQCRQPLLQLGLLGLQVGQLVPFALDDVGRGLPRKLSRQQSLAAGDAALDVGQFLR